MRFVLIENCEKFETLIVQQAARVYFKQGIVTIEQMTQLNTVQMPRPSFI